jgi:F0F1-type ATP synthase membrane subunit b/b'
MISIDSKYNFSNYQFSLSWLPSYFDFFSNRWFKLWKALKSYLGEEMEKIEKEKKAAEELRLKYEEESKNIHIKYQEMQQEYANQEAVKIKSKIINEAYQESEKIKQTAEEKARIEIDKLYSD